MRKRQFLQAKSSHFGSPAAKMVPMLHGCFPQAITTAGEAGCRCFKRTARAAWTRPLLSVPA
jgi:hypothetical protein